MVDGASVSVLLSPVPVQLQLLVVLMTGDDTQNADDCKKKLANKVAILMQTKQ